MDRPVRISYNLGAITRKVCELVALLGIRGAMFVAVS